MTISEQIEIAFTVYKTTHSDTNTVFAPLCTYHDFLKEQGYYLISEWDPNGWEVDFNEDFYNPETKDWVTLSGSLYYGNFQFKYYEYCKDYDESDIERAIKYAN